MEQRIIKEFNQAIQLLFGINESNSDIDFYNELKENENYFSKNKINGIPKNEIDLLKAIDLFEELLQIETNCKLIYNYCGIAYKRLKRYAEAVKCFDKAITLDSNYKVGYCNRANVKKTIRDYVGALNDYSKALLIDRNYFESLIGRGRVNVLMGNTSEAIQDFTRAIELNPEYYEAYKERAIAKTKQKDFEGAIEDLDISIDKFPSNPQFYVLKGALCKDLGKIDLCIQTFKEAILFLPNNPFLYVNLGNAYALKLEYENAIDSFSVALNLKSDFNDAYEFRADVYIHLNCYQQALQDLNKIINDDTLKFELYKKRAIVKKLLNDIEGYEKDMAKANEVFQSVMNLPSKIN